MLEYLSRYTQHSAISNERIRCVSKREVAFSVRADEHGGKQLVRLDGAEFVRRFMWHILPTGLKQIRHGAVLESAFNGVKLTAARACSVSDTLHPSRRPWHKLQSFWPA